MGKIQSAYQGFVERIVNKLHLAMRAKLLIIFLTVKIIPLIVVVSIAWVQVVHLGNELRDIAVQDSSQALNDSAVENIERMSTDAAQEVAEFLYARDNDIRYLANLVPTEESYRTFIEARRNRLVAMGEWELAPDGQSWIEVNPPEPFKGEGGISLNSENDDRGGFHYRMPEVLNYANVPLYDEISFIGLDGMEQIKVVAKDSTKKRYPMNPEKRDVSKRENTFVKAETYFSALKELKPGEIYVSDVIGAYVGTNYIGMYTPEIVENAAADRGYEIVYDAEQQAFAGRENPNGQRFEGIVRWAMPVLGSDGQITGYVSFALNHDHIMEFVDHITPMNERYTELPSAFEGNYAFIWDYNCRSIAHPRHHSITGFDPETGNPQVPWLETSIYEAWKQSGEPNWWEYTSENVPPFYQQSREKMPAVELTKASLVGLDGRYLNNAPQCTGWMNLTQDGGSGSFYILWSGLYKLNTAASIPYYTGQYAPNENNGFSRRGFGFVAIGAGLEDFTRPATETKERLEDVIRNNLASTAGTLLVITSIIIILLVLIAIWLASWLTNSIRNLLSGISRFRAGERQFRFKARIKDEFGELADAFDEMADSLDSSVKNTLCITDMNQKVIYMNQKGLDLCKTTLEEMVGSDYRKSSLFPADSSYSPITALIQGREAEIYYDEQGDFYLKGTASYFLSKDGEKLGYIVESADVTDMARERMKVEEQRTLLDQMFSSSPDLIWYVNVAGEYLSVNPRFAAISGKPVEAFVGKSVKDMFSDDVAALLSRNDNRAMQAKSPVYSEETIRFADGHEESLDSVRTPIFDTNGERMAMLGFARNVSRRVEVERELREMQINLESAVNQANIASAHKGEFLARMSHEIRTPMNAIIGLTSIVLKKIDDGDKRAIKSHVRQIEASSQHLLGLLNDILDISKIEAGKIELVDESVVLPKLLSTVAGIIKPRCDEKHIQFNTYFEDFQPNVFMSDSLRLRQVLINLLGNAVKFTPEHGRIDFICKMVDHKDDCAMVRFTVKDDGIGISEEMQKVIFQPFEQADQSIARTYGGTGLGLAITQRIVQLLGGEVELLSKQGEGSEFSFAIWLKETTSDLPQDAQISDVAGRFKGRRALLVDDVDINRMIVKMLLEDTDIKIDEAEDGIEAIRMFQESPEGTYDIVFMDVQMPRMDGYEATRGIRKLDRSDAKTTPIIAVTANAFKEDMDRAVKSGMNAHLTKPIEMDKLAEVLIRYLPTQ